VIRYDRILCVFLSVFIALAALFVQLMIAGLSAGAGALPATLSIHIVMIIGGPALVIVFLICLLGGVRWSVLTTGWMLVLQCLICLGVLLTLSGPAAGSALDRYPDAMAGLLAVMALALSFALVRYRRRGRRRSARHRPAD